MKLEKLDGHSHLTVQGVPVPSKLVGELAATDTHCDLSARLDLAGYLLLRSVHDERKVMAARLEILEHLAEVGEVAAPIAEGIATGKSRRAEVHHDLGAFWKSVSESAALRSVIQDSGISSVMTRLFGQPAASFSFVWLRAMAAGRASPLHIDHPYMNRGSARLVTCWTPLGQVGMDDGPLYILEGSHQWSTLRDRFQEHDVDRDKSRSGHIEEHPVDLAAAHQSRLLTAEFMPGDCLIFGMFTAHGSFDNASQAGRIRLSCDTRFQPAADPMDQRFAGPDPRAHGGLGYGCLAAARPMSEPLQVR